VIDSGNGAYLLYRVELAPERARVLLPRVLQALVEHYDTPACHIDRVVWNPARIARLPGTANRKGTASAERPHRLARLLEVPEPLVVVPDGLLEELAAEVPEEIPPRPPRTDLPPLDLVGACIAADLYLRPGRGGKHFIRCPWRDGHSMSSGPTETALFEPPGPGEPWGFDCRHRTCAHRTVADLRAFLGIRPSVPPRDDWTFTGPPTVLDLDPPAEHVVEEPGAEPEHGTRAKDDKKTSEASEAAGSKDEKRRAVPWDAIRSVVEYLKTEESDATFLDEEQRFFARGVVTEWFAPRGLGKTNVMYVLLVRAVMRGLRVLLIDRDNPRREIKRRLRACGAADLTPFNIVDRNEAPPLTNRAAWAQFPVNDFDIVVIDSLDAATEGVGEKDSARPAQALAPLLNLARHEHGPAVLILGNTIKSALHSRGSGVMEDRADIVYELRDITGFLPSGKKPWWEELPPGGVEFWAERATRRRRRERYRLAFTPSKFRVGPEPDPFVLEMRHNTAPWSAEDVTETMEAEGEASRDAARQKAETTRKEAIDALKAEVVRCAAAKQDLLVNQDAVPFLKRRGLSREAARVLIEEGNGTHWQIEKLLSRSQEPRILLPLSDTPSKGPTAASSGVSAEAHEKGQREATKLAVGMDSGPQASLALNLAPDAASRGGPSLRRSPVDRHPGDEKQGASEVGSALQVKSQVGAPREGAYGDPPEEEWL
jgi:hypothetical protein